jgi:broad specificity phosphatase PhoE
MYDPSNPMCPPCPPPLVDQQLSMDIEEVAALCQLRRDEGRSWAARATPVSIPGGGKVVHFIRDADHCNDLDAPLTDAGRKQARALADTVAPLGVQLVVASPLRRALQTALHAFGDFIEAEMLAPVVAHEALREQHGVHGRDQRRDTASIGAEFGARVNLEQLVPTDELWTNEREPKGGVADRCEEFVRWLMGRPEDNIAVVAHHQVLLVLCNCVIECGDGGGFYQGLLDPFSVGEMRHVRIEPWAPDDEMDEDLDVPPYRYDPSNPMCPPCPSQKFVADLTAEQQKFVADLSQAAATATVDEGGVSRKREEEEEMDEDDNMVQSNEKRQRVDE